MNPLSKLAFRLSGRRFLKTTVRLLIWGGHLLDFISTIPALYRSFLQLDRIEGGYQIARFQGDVPPAQAFFLIVKNPAKTELREIPFYGNKPDFIWSVMVFLAYAASEHQKNASGKHPSWVLRVTDDIFYQIKKTPSELDYRSDV